MVSLAQYFILDFILVLSKITRHSIFGADLYFFLSKIHDIIILIFYFWADPHNKSILAASPVIIIWFQIDTDIKIDNLTDRLISK